MGKKSPKKVAPQPKKEEKKDKLSENKEIQNKATNNKEIQHKAAENKEIKNKAPENIDIQNQEIKDKATKELKTTENNLNKENKETERVEKTVDPALVEKDIDDSQNESEEDNQNEAAEVPEKDKPLDKEEMLRRMFDSDAVTTVDPETRTIQTRSADGKKTACLFNTPIDPKSKYGKLRIALHKMLESDYYVSEYEKAQATYNILEYHITQEDWKTTQNLVDTILNLNREILARYYDQTTPENVIRRMKKIIVDEYKAQAKLQPEGHISVEILKTVSFRNVVLDDIPPLADDCDPEKVAKKMRKPLIIAMREYKIELDNVLTVYAKVAPNYINEGDNIYTYSYDPCISAMLVALAKQGANMNLFVVETAPHCHSYLYADALYDYPNVIITIVHDACIDQVACKINKVLLPCNALAKNGVIKTVTTGFNFTLVTEGINTVLIAANFQLSATERIQTNKLFKSNGIDCFKYDILEKTIDNVKTILTNTGTIATSQVDKTINDLYTPKKEKEEAYVIEKRYVHKKYTPAE